MGLFSFLFGGGGGKALKRANIDKRFELSGRTGQLATVQELVALGHGISFVPEMARRVDASPHRVYRSLSGDRPRRTIAACWNPDRYQARLALAFLDALRSYRPGGPAASHADAT